MVRGRVVPVSDRILGTRVPDNRIHRASLWLEDLKGRLDRPRAWEGMPVDLELLLRDCGVHDLTAPEIVGAVEFYGQNFIDMFPSLERVTFMHGQLGAVPASSVVRSAWVDGFAHGAASVAGLRGDSNAERERR